MAQSPVSLLHTPLVQSDALPHGTPAQQRAHFPPQSMWVSSPLSTPSEQDAAEHVNVAQSHTEDTQSCVVPHLDPAKQPAAQLPPQSTSASSPLWTPSKHEGALHTK